MESLFNVILLERACGVRALVEPTKKRSFALQHAKALQACAEKALNRTLSMDSFFTVLLSREPYRLAHPGQAHR
jgi:hypothetical protein